MSDSTSADVAAARAPGAVPVARPPSTLERLSNRGFTGATRVLTWGVVVLAGYIV